MKKINVDRIKEYISNGDEKFVIIPFGRRGREIKELLNEKLGVIEQFCVDNYIYDLLTVFPMEKMPKNYTDCKFLMAIEDMDQRLLLEQMLLEYVDETQIIKDVITDDEENEVFMEEEKVSLDFLCVGFPKCGTTSLDSELRKNTNVFLPRGKETKFAKEVNLRSHELFRTLYPKDETNGKIVGGIDPGYYNRSESVYKYFGENTKLIFMVSNPINALYSLFKLEMKQIPEDRAVWFQKFEKVSPEMFDGYAEIHYKKYLYMNYINEYLRYYPKDKMKFVISEELFEKPDETMNDIQDFIGLKKDERIECTEFPFVSSGKRVTKDYDSALINNMLTNLCMEPVDQKRKFDRFLIRKKIFEITTCEYSEEMLKKTQKKLFEYYINDIHELEKFIGKKLEGVWY